MIVRPTRSRTVSLVDDQAAASYTQHQGLPILGLLDHRPLGLDSDPIETAAMRAEAPHSGPTLQ